MPLEPVEPLGQRLRRRGRRLRLYTTAFAAVALLVVLVALVLDNTGKVKIGWVFGSGRVSLVWVIVASAVLGWLLGIVMGILFRLRTRRRRSSNGVPDPSRG
ncbi:MAG TPA: LapA family protein [Gaiellaceae bacterium]|nr:LapA family protein [Gaiellaceae bacterium]